MNFDEEACNGAEKPQVVIDRIHLLRKVLREEARNALQRRGIRLKETLLTQRERKKKLKEEANALGKAEASPQSTPAAPPGVLPTSDICRITEILAMLQGIAVEGVQPLIPVGACTTVSFSSEPNCTEGEGLPQGGPSPSATHIIEVALDPINEYAKTVEPSTALAACMVQANTVDFILSMSRRVLHLLTMSRHDDYSTSSPSDEQEEKSPLSAAMKADPYSSGAAAAAAWNTLSKCFGTLANVASCNEQNLKAQMVKGNTIPLLHEAFQAITVSKSCTKERMRPSEPEAGAGSSLGQYVGQGSTGTLREVELYQEKLDGTLVQLLRFTGNLCWGSGPGSAAQGGKQLWFETATKWEQGDVSIRRATNGFVDTIHHEAGLFNPLVELREVLALSLKRSECFLQSTVGSPPTQPTDSSIVADRLESSSRWGLGLLRWTCHAIGNLAYGGAPNPAQLAFLRVGILNELLHVFVALGPALLQSFQNLGQEMSEKTPPPGTSLTSPAMQIIVTLSVVSECCFNLMFRIPKEEVFAALFSTQPARVGSINYPNDLLLQACGIGETLLARLEGLSSATVVGSATRAEDSPEQHLSNCVKVLKRCVKVIQECLL